MKVICIVEMCMHEYCTFLFVYTFVISCTLASHFGIILQINTKKALLYQLNLGRSQFKKLEINRYSKKIK